MALIDEVQTNGFSILNDFYSETEVINIIAIINKTSTEKDTFRKSNDLFAIRQFLKEVPETIAIIFNHRLKAILRDAFGGNFFVVKSIYFDKPTTSNWYVAYHQDLTISVDQKLNLAGFEAWTVKQNQYAVQPPLAISENILTIRIHLDDTDAQNGALNVIPKSHAKGIYRPETIDWTTEQAVSCPVSMGGIMLMKPLLLHSSDKTTNHKQRRVIHIEFSNQELPKELSWSERLAI